MRVLVHSNIIFSFFYELYQFYGLFGNESREAPIVNVTLMAIRRYTKWAFTNKTISLRSIFIRCRHINIMWFVCGVDDSVGFFLRVRYSIVCSCSSASLTTHGLNIICYIIAHIFMLLSIRFGIRTILYYTIHVYLLRAEYR